VVAAWRSGGFHTLARESIKLFIRSDFSARGNAAIAPNRSLAARLRAGAENPSNPVSFLRLLADVDAANGSKQTHSRRKLRKTLLLRGRLLSPQSSNSILFLSSALFIKLQLY